MESESSISSSQQAHCFSTKQERRSSLVTVIFSCYRILQLLCFKISTAKWNLEDTSVRYGVSWNRRCSSGNLHLHGAFECVIQEWQFVALNCAVAKIVYFCLLSNDRMTVNIFMERNGKLRAWRNLRYYTRICVEGASGITADIPVQIRNGHLSKAKTKYYQLRLSARHWGLPPDKS